jgi:hypothetical protein
MWGNTMSSDGFDLGQTVHLRADTRRQGAIVAVLPAIGNEPRYGVFHSPSEIVDSFASQLIVVASPSETRSLSTSNSIQRHG